MSKPAFWCAMAAAIGAALALRLADLGARPMHHDEANQAIRFGQLLETGVYRYDPAEHHGPTLYYLTLPSAWIRGQTTTASLDEWTLRGVPALFGAGTILLWLLLVRGVGRTAVAVAGATLAVSPPLVYYSRFYIQESLLLFFSVGFLVTAARYVTTARPREALWAGAFAGLAVATKETAVILIPAALLACAIARWWGGRMPNAGGAVTRNRQPDGASGPRIGDGLPVEPLWAAGAVAIAVAALFYSSFFTNLPGLVEPLRAAQVYLDRGLAPTAHREPWHYYLQLMVHDSNGGAGWVELGLLAPAIAGVGLALRREAGPTAFWARCLLVYSLITTAAFSALPYKTPWNVLPLFGAWSVLAAMGAAEALDRATLRTARTLIAVGVVGICAALGMQAWRASFRYAADPRNPYAYVHTSPDIVRLARRVADLSDLHPDREKMLVAVIAAPSEQWPLPWYFRRMPSVGYWPTPEAAAAAMPRAAVVVASPEHAAEVGAALGERYQSEFYGLRPNVLMTVFIERSLWERFIESVR